ncbi:MAG TPA: hypothetical protein P5280_11300 [Cyclobacteriaceae bacterium]|nr:hypothetical protein [Cyclobacteriaceae bacterium]
MKKLIYLVLFVLIAGVSVSCSEENIEPQSGNGGAGEVQKY